MKGFLKVLFLLIIVVGVASPFAAGFMLEKQYNEMIAHLNQAYAGEIVFTGKFDRGFMDSTASTELSAKGVSIETLQHVVHHGPVIIDFKGWLNPSSYVPRGYGLAKVDTQLTGKFAQKLTNIYAGKPAYNIITIIAFNGDSATTFVNYPLTTQVGVGILKWQGANGSIDIDKAVTKISGTMLIPSLEYSEPVQAGPDTETLQLSNLKFDFNKMIAEDSDMLNITLDAFKILNKTTEDVGLNNVTLMFTKKAVNKVEGAELKTAFSKLKIAHHDVGPFALGVKVSNINSAAMLAAMQEKIHSNIPSDQMVAILSTTPTLDADLKVTMPEGNIDYTGHVSAGGANITSADPAVIIPTVKMSQKLQIGSKIVMKLLHRYIEEQVHVNEKAYFTNNKTSAITNPWTMTPEQLNAMSVKMADDMVNILKTKQFIVEQNEVMSTDVEFANSVLTVNGVQHTKADLDQLHSLLEIKAPVPVPAPVPVITPPVTQPAPSAIPVVTAPVAPQAVPDKTH